MSRRTEGRSGGRTVIDHADDDLQTRRTIEDRVVVTRATERIFTGEMSSGGPGDLDVATRQIAELYATFGLGGDPLHLGAGTSLLGELALSPDLRGRVSRDLRRLEKRAATLMQANRDAVFAVFAVATKLAEKRHLDGRAIEEIVRERLVAPAGSRRHWRAVGDADLRGTREDGAD
ncbi:ATP-dependent Zn protease [Bradyrhizobium sp. USDA 4501]